MEIDEMKMIINGIEKEYSNQKDIIGKRDNKFKLRAEGVISLCKVLKKAIELKEYNKELQMCYVKV